VGGEGRRIADYERRALNQNPDRNAQMLKKGKAEKLSQNMNCGIVNAKLFEC
jgi:hypothetical protein